MTLRAPVMATFFTWIGVVVSCTFLMALAVSDAGAATISAQQCSASNPDFNTSIPTGGIGLVTQLENSVRSSLNNMSRDLYQAIEGSNEFKDALVGAITLYIAIYGLFFALGMVQYTVYDFSMRLIKLALVVMLVNGSSWNFFNTHVVQFFEQGTIEIINKVTSIAIGGAPPIGSQNAALAVLDSAAQKLLSANMAAHLIATTLTSAYGLAYGALLFLGMMSFLGVLLTGIWVYLMSLVLRALLFGIAPMFLACMLFDRTKPLFLGWLNQVINACLQPIFLFTFMAFFVMLVQSTIDQILSVPVCWMQAGETKRGGVSTGMFWWTFRMNASPDSEIQVMPSGEGMQMDIMAILIFLILSDLCRRFSYIAIQVARDIAVGAVDLSQMSSGIGSLFGDSGGSTGGGSSTVGSRLNPSQLRTGVSNQTLSNISSSGLIGGIKSSLGNLSSTRK